MTNDNDSPPAFPNDIDTPLLPGLELPADLLTIAGVHIGLGETRDVALEVSQQYSGAPVHIPIRVWRAPEPGPTVAVVAAMHGDEINGTGIVRELILHPPFDLLAGTLVLVPVVNIPGFERHARYLPDRRDLNRSFPGRKHGTLASRYAHAFFHNVIKACDCCIDLHTAGVRRTNFPNVRADLGRPEVKRIAMAFGCELVVSSKGPKGSLRQAATRAGCPTISLEAGEIWKIEPTVGEIGVRGVRNVLVELGMVEGPRHLPAYQARINRTTWIRADHGGTLTFHVAPGDPVNHRQPLVTIADLLGQQRHIVRAPRAGIVMGMTTWPAVKPGNPVCHLAIPQGGVSRIRAALTDMPTETLTERIRSDLATSISVSEVRDGDWRLRGSGNARGIEVGQSGTASS